MSAFAFKFETEQGVYTFPSRGLAKAVKELIRSNSKIRIVSVEAFLTVEGESGRVSKWVTCKPKVWHPVAGYDHISNKSKI